MTVSWGRGINSDAASYLGQESHRNLSLLLDHVHIFLSYVGDPEIVVPFFNNVASPPVSHKGIFMWATSSVKKPTGGNDNPEIPVLHNLLTRVFPKQGTFFKKIDPQKFVDVRCCLGL